MRHYVKPVKTPLDPPTIEPVTSSLAEVSVQRLIDDSLLALSREVRNLLTRSAVGKLEANDARDLREHLKLLFELRDREKDSLAGMTDEELEAKAKAALGDNK